MRGDNNCHLSAVIRWFPITESIRIARHRGDPELSEEYGQEQFSARAGGILGT
jgi:hypothetical protein